MQEALESQLHAFRSRRLIAMPIAGMVMWAVVGVCALVVPQHLLPWILFACTGGIVYLAVLISPLTGESLLNTAKEKNAFDRLFLFVMIMSWSVFAIAIPFFLVLPSSLPMTVGILSGILWIPVTWLLQHWIGLVHGLVRTLLIVAVWYLWPEHRYIAIASVIVILYIFAIVVLDNRWRNYNASIGISSN